MSVVELRPALMILAVAVAVVMLIVCADLSNLLSGENRSTPEKNLPFALLSVPAESVSCDKLLTKSLSWHSQALFRFGR